MKRNGIRGSSAALALAVLAVACGTEPGSGSDPDSPRRVIVKSSTADARSVSLHDGTPMASDPEVVVLSDGEASPASRAPSASTEPARARRAAPPRVIEEVVYVFEERRDAAPRPTTGPPSRPATAPDPVPQTRPSTPATPPVRREPEVATAPTAPTPAPRPAPTPERSSRVEDAAIGAAIGAGVGAVLGGERGAARGAIGGAVGGAVGGRTGAVLGGVLGGSRGGRPAPRRGGGCRVQPGGGFDLVVR